MTNPTQVNDDPALCPECEGYFDPDDIHIEDDEAICIFCYMDSGEEDD